MKSTLSLLITTLALSSIVYASPLPDYPFISVEGIATTNIAPDMAYISIQIASVKIDPADAVEIVSKKTEEILKMLTTSGIDYSSITILGLDKSFINLRNGDFYYDGFVTLGKGQEEVQGYQISQEMKVTIDDLTQYEKVLPPLLDMKYVTIRKTYFSHSGREILEAELIKAACLNAKNEAHTLAKGFDAKVGLLKAVSKENFSNLWNRYDGDNFNRTILKRTSVPSKNIFVPATIGFEAKVNAIYQIMND